MGLGIAYFGVLVIVLLVGVVLILKLGFFREGVFVLRECFEIALKYSLLKVSLFWVRLHLGI